jgi:hypothetical protein
LRRRFPDQYHLIWLGLAGLLALLLTSTSGVSRGQTLTPTPSPASLYLPHLVQRYSEPTPTQTPMAGTLVVTGRVYDAALGPSAPIPRTSVRLTFCINSDYSAQSGQDGEYYLAIPELYWRGCDLAILQVWARGYYPLVEVLPVRELLFQSRRDIPLSRYTPTPSVTPLPDPSMTPTPTATPTVIPSRGP